MNTWSEHNGLASLIVDSTRVLSMKLNKFNKKKELKFVQLIFDIFAAGSEMDNYFILAQILSENIYHSHSAF